MKRTAIVLFLSALCLMVSAQSNAPREGKYVYSYASGQDSVVCFYKDGRPVGQRTEYYPSGVIRMTMTYNKGKLESLKQYFDNGSLKREEKWDGFSATEGKQYDADGKEVDYTPYIQLPQFTGGNRTLMEVISKLVKYPVNAVKEKREGLVVVKCVIDKEGNCTSTKVVKSAFADLDEEAIRVVKTLSSSYKFTPGTIEGEPKDMSLTIPVRFRL